MLTVTKENKRVTVDDISIRDIVETFIGLCEVELVLMDADSKYVGSDNVDCFVFGTNIAHDFAEFKLQYHMRECRVKVISDDLYQKYLDKVTMLSNDSRGWDFIWLGTSFLRYPKI